MRALAVSLTQSILPQATVVAVKVLSDQSMSEEALKEFRTEVTMMSKMRHPNVVLLMGICSSAPNLAIVTEYLARGSLYRLLHHTEVKLDDRRRVKMGIDIAKGMAYLHSASPPIVHRDLKSPNLLVVREHTPHDFPPLLHPINPTGRITAGRDFHGQDLRFRAGALQGGYLRCDCQRLRRHAQLHGAGGAAQ